MSDDLTFVTHGVSCDRCAMEDARTDRVGCRGGVYHTAFYTLKPYANSPLSVSVSPRSRDRDRDRDRGGVGGSLKSQHVDSQRR